MPTPSKEAKKCQTMTYMPITIFSCQTTSKKGQISRIWPQKCQPGNPGDGATHLAVEYDRLELGLYDVLCGVTCAQSYHTVLISKICSYLMFYALGNITVLISKKCPCLGLASLFFHIFCGLIFLNKQYLIDMQTISNSL